VLSIGGGIENIFAGTLAGFYSTNAAGLTPSSDQASDDRRGKKQRIQRSMLSTRQERCKQKSVEW